ERIALKDPVFDLRIDANGRKSWQFASASDDGLVRLAQAQPPAGTASDAPRAANAKPPAPKAGGTSAAALEDISIDEVTIENGNVHYKDARSGVRRDASNIEARFKMPSLARALEGEGELAWGGEQMSF